MLFSLSKCSTDAHFSWEDLQIGTWASWKEVEDHVSFAKQEQNREGGTAIGKPDWFNVFIALDISISLVVEYVYA